uniref:Uncharacterized protein n=1 Tax=viral metagenome TaxID=1070528 RepID=A0A6C0KYG0_9ZZZZ
MGNSLSNNINKDNDSNGNLLKTIDNIASSYIFKQNIVDMLRFSDSQYRENFVILTCRILDKKLSNLNIDALKSRILDSKQVNRETKYGEIVYFSEHEKMKSLLTNESDKKKALLIISKFYVKILTLFSSIVSVVDPQYIYTDENGENIFFYLKDFDDLKMIDTTTNKLKVYHLENPLSLVKRRLFILKNKMDQQDDNSEYIVLNPGEELCSMNIPESNDGVLKLSNEIGIKELDSLYFDLYDEETSKWSGRSKEMQEQYKKDVTLFYQIFTGKKNKPSKVTSFEDIELLDFHNLRRCKNNDYFEDLLVSKNDVLFQKYLTKIEEIQQGTSSYKKQLLYILKSIFQKKESQDGENDEIDYTIHPDLNMETLLEKQKQIKNCIVQMYSSCEKNFIEALLIYEKMYDNRYGELVDAQVNNISFNNKIIENNKPNENSLHNDNVILNGNLLLNNKIKMPEVNNNNKFKFTNNNANEGTLAKNQESVPTNEIVQQPIITTTPIQVTPTTSAASSPVEVSEPPVEVSEPPLEVSEPPVEVSEPPVEVSEPPVEVSEPPVEVSEPPVEVSEPPVEVSEPPLEVSEPPLEVSEPPLEVSDVKTPIESGTNNRFENMSEPPPVVQAAQTAPPTQPLNSFENMSEPPPPTNPSSVPPSMEQNDQSENIGVEKEVEINSPTDIRVDQSNVQNVANSSQEEAVMNENKILLNVDSGNSNNIKLDSVNNQKSSLTEKGEKAQKSFINNLSNFFT